MLPNPSHTHTHTHGYKIVVDKDIDIVSRLRAYIIYFDMKSGV